MGHHDEGSGMIEESDRAHGVRRRVRPGLAAIAMIAGAATMVACGDSSDDAPDGAAKTKAAATTAPKPAASTTTNPAETGTNVPADVQAWSKSGTVRLAALWIGTPGKLSVEPKGNMTAEDPKSWDHWYPKGTEVTVTAENTKTARFLEWSGACAGKDRVCKVTMTDYKRLIGGFKLDKKGAKGLPKNDPALKPGTGS
jgi:hypothetical protein